MIQRWSRLAATMPWMANALLQTRGVSALMKWAGGIAPRRRIPRYAGIDHEIMASGCCGMADSFGFERDKYDVSITATERVLFPPSKMYPLTN